MIRNNSARYAHILLALGAATCSALSNAQTDPPRLEEVVVTAQKRQESVQDVPIAISALKGDTLDALGATEVTDINLFVPGLSGITYGVGTNTWAIRGISTNDPSVGSEPSVAVFLDDAYVGRNVFATDGFFDVARIEVAKGPQGTLYGRNASAGAISIISNKPGDENSLALRLAGGKEGQDVDLHAGLTLLLQLGNDPSQAKLL